MIPHSYWRFLQTRKVRNTVITHRRTAVAPYSAFGELDHPEVDQSFVLPWTWFIQGPNFRAINLTCFVETVPCLSFFFPHSYFIICVWLFTVSCNRGGTTLGSCMITKYAGGWKIYVYSIRAASWICRCTRAPAPITSANSACILTYYTRAVRWLMPNVILSHCVIQCLSFFSYY